MTKKDTQFRIELGDDGRYLSKGVGTIRIEREFGSPLHLKDVLYVPGLKNNLVSVSTLEDKGYEVIFQQRKGLPQALELWSYEADWSG